jgi:hypothetical protein
MSTAILRITSLLTVLFVLNACTTVPSGPSVLVLPGGGKSFDQFRADDLVCRQFAFDQLGGTTTSSAAVSSGVKSAAVGTAVGAVAGAAINGSRGAGVGAGTGMVMGGLSGTGAASARNTIHSDATISHMNNACTLKAIAYRLLEAHCLHSFNNQAVISNN